MDALNPPNRALASFESVAIRRATTADSVRLSELTQRFFPYIHVSADHVFDRMKTGVVYLVLEAKDGNHDSMLAGFIDVELNAEPNPRHATVSADGTPHAPLDAPKTAKILGLCVVPELRGQGWGKKLLNAALNEAKQMGCTQAVMLVEESNRKAISMYEKAGFQKRGKLAQKLWDKDVLLYIKAL